MHVYIHAKVSILQSSRTKLLFYHARSHIFTQEDKQSACSVSDFYHIYACMLIIVKHIHEKKKSSHRYMLRLKPTRLPFG